MNKIYFASILAMTLVLSACTGSEEQKNAEITYEGNNVTVSAESPILNKLTIETLDTKPFSNEFRTVGTVQAENGKFAEVNLPFDGRVVRTNVSLGSKVSAGQVLFEVSSPDFLDASKTYFQNKQNYDKAKADYERKQVLAKHGIASEKDLQESQVEFENARQEMEFSKASLKAYGTNPEQMHMGQAMNIVSPITGEVVMNEVTVGSFVKADSDPMMAIADLHKVWVNARVKEQNIAQVSQGGKAEVHLESEPSTVIEGKILNVGNLVDDETRSVQVIISCDNDNMKLKHGMYVSVHFLDEPHDAIVVPSTAVFQGENRSFVYVCTGSSNTFERREVQLGQSSDDNSQICVLSGLHKGERIVAVGGLYLND